MRRWLTILLLSVLPLQFVWAAVAGYCQHDSGETVKHFGHHEHKHDVPEDAEQGADDGQLPLADFDGDCTDCHASCAVAPSAAVALPVIPVLSFAIPWASQLPAPPPLTQPDRPNWSVSA
ncbi:MAG: Cation efflux system protein CzcI [Candidatus Accumulibacter adjunctus]|uniref:Cation efflux system protein CzcI n=1 Tax=Candidatus Accumulibacter adjunctus TaxID=1454001 RepID=A0A011PLS0_9PROT|nr:MAG: Cation efflux system protein CzcI [Candidatus Accumulibacter adjunctus]